MIQPIKQSLAFQGSEIPPVYQSVAKTQPFYATQPRPEMQGEPEQKEGFFKRVKRGFMNFLKGFNNVKNTGSGFVRGAVEGIAASVVIGTVGKNIIESKNDIFKTLKGVVIDVGNAALGVIKFIPSIITKAPIENLKNIIDLPAKFVKYMLGNPQEGVKAAKSNKFLVAIAAISALAILAYRTVQGKIAANKENANIDHALNEGHLSTK